MGTIQQKSLWFNIKLSESIIFTPPTRLGIYELNSEDKHFQGRIPPNERPEIICDLIQYIQREFQIDSPISLFGSNGYIYTNSESVDILPQYCTLLVCPAIATKHMSTPTLSQRPPILNCSASAISSELNASTNTTMASTVPHNPVINPTTMTGGNLLDSDSNVDDTNSNDTTQEDDEEILETTTMRKPVFTAKSMRFADWDFLDVQRRLKTFIDEANIEGRQKLKKWFLEFYETYELKCSASTNLRAEIPDPCSSIDTNENENTMVTETLFNDPTSQLTQTLTEATPAAFKPIANGPGDNSVLEPLMDDTDFGDPTSQLTPTLAEVTPAAFPPISNEPVDNLVSESLIDDTGSGSDVEGLSLLYILDSTSIAEMVEVSGSDLEETSLLEDNNTRTFVIDISKTTADTPESNVQGSNCEVVRSFRVKSQNTRCQNVPLEIQKLAKRQQETHLTSKPKTVTATANPNGHSCSYPSCNFKTQGLFNFKKHLGKLHFETPFKCGKCGREYRLYNSYFDHLTTHEERKHVCLFKNCSYKTHRSSHLKRHMMTHSAVKRVKPFACKKCKYRAFTGSHLKEHMRKHTGEKPFACKQCEYRCRTSTHLKSHVSRRHGVEK